MRVRLLDHSAYIFTQPDFNSPPLATVVVGNEFELGAEKKKEGRSWVKVTLPNGQQGYILGDAKVYIMKQVNLLEDTRAYWGPALNAPLMAFYPKQTQVMLVDTFDQEGKSWVKIRDQAGHEGFIEGGTKINVVGEQGVKGPATRATGWRNVGVGLLWCIGGIIVTSLSYEAARNGGTYLVTWGAILFGGIQVLQGLFQVITAKE
jgi:hypothetical protein